MNLGNPTQNDYNEWVNGSIKGDLLNAYLFNSLSEVRCWSEEWRIDNKIDKANNSLEHLSPLYFTEQFYKRSKIELVLYPQMKNSDIWNVAENHLIYIIVESEN